MRVVTQVGHFETNARDYVTSQVIHDSSSGSGVSLRVTFHDEAWIEPSGELFVSKLCSEKKYSYLRDVEVNSSRTHPVDAANSVAGLLIAIRVEASEWIRTLLVEDGTASVQRGLELHSWNLCIFVSNTAVSGRAGMGLVPWCQGPNTAVLTRFATFLLVPCPVHTDVCSLLSLCATLQITLTRTWRTL